MDSRLNIGYVQFDVRLADVEANLHAALTGIDQLGQKGTDLAVLPEMWSCGFDNLRLSDHARQTPRILQQISHAASLHGMIIAGSLPELTPDGVYNTLFVVDRDGTVVGKYRKVHLFSLTQEHRFFRAGTTAVVCQSTIGPLGLMICYDLRFPELCRTLALQGARLVVISAQWPLARIGHWQALLIARALENQLFIVAANRCGADPDIQYGGHSGIISPSGKPLTVGGNGTEAISTTIDFREMERFRAQIPCLKERMTNAYCL